MTGLGSSTEPTRVRRSGGVTPTLSPRSAPAPRHRRPARCTQARSVLADGQLAHGASVPSPAMELLEAAHLEPMPRPLGDPGSRGPRRGERGEAGDPMRHGGPANMEAVGPRTRSSRGVHDELDLPAGDELDGIGPPTSVTHLRDDRGDTQAR